MTEKKTFKQRVTEAQNELNAPKSQWNKFGKYHYRSCEDICTAAKPINKKHNLVLTVSDEVVVIGDRFYVKATARLKDCESEEAIEVTAFAREEQTKKGMDGSQITGTASSYARKYALNGLYMIDDNKDADTNEQRQQMNNAPQQQQQAPQQAPQQDGVVAKYEQQLRQAGVDINAFYQWIVQQEHCNTIFDVPQHKLVGYLKSQCLKLQKNKVEEAEQW